jgi:hypothetical protein
MIGKVAKCRRGYTGLVTQVYKQPLYLGICLDAGRVGKPWQSNDPELIGTLDDWVRLRHAEILEEEEKAAEGVFRSTFDYPTRRDLT